MKSIQEKLASALWEYKTEIEKQGIYHLISHGFERKKSIITNAKPHRNKRFVLNLDLENFFDSFHFGRVRGFFEKNRVLPLPHEVATVIAQLTCFEGSLPQGAPTSPIRQKNPMFATDHQAGNMRCDESHKPDDPGKTDDRRR